MSRHVGHAGKKRKQHFNKQNNHRGGKRFQKSANSFSDAKWHDGIAASVNEKDVGIEGFLSPKVGFSGLIKERYSDFLVNEVDQKGKVVKLTSIPQIKAKPKSISQVIKARVWAYFKQGPENDIGKSIEEKKELSSVIKLVANKVLEHSKILLFEQDRLLGEKSKVEEMEQIEEVCGQEVRQHLAQYIDRIRATKDITNFSEVFLFPSKLNKEQRSRLHEISRGAFMSVYIVADTLENQDIKQIRLRARTTKNSDEQKKREKYKWPKDTPDFVDFVLHKQNKETLDCIRQLSSILRVQPNRFSYAGTKDKRGITCQKIRVYRVEKERLVGINKKLSSEAMVKQPIVLGNMNYAKEKLNLGDLRGNEFQVVVRDILPLSGSELCDVDVKDAIEYWKKFGFVNYFGMQRFGTSSVPTHWMGRSLLKRDYKKVVELILHPREGDSTGLSEVRSFVKENPLKVKEALQKFPNYLIAERSILEGLVAHGHDAYNQAIHKIPRNLRMMYTHAYQSYLWNSAASARMKFFSKTTPVVGDLVVEKEDQTLLENADMDDEGASIGLEVSKRRSIKDITIKVLSLEDISTQKYSIDDVVLPMPGYETVLPENSIGELYQELMKNDGVDFSIFSAKNSGEYHLPGSYRKLIQKPTCVEFDIKKYDDPYISLLNTDIESLYNKSPVSSIENGKHKALCLKFQLATSSYATICLRELLKQSSCIHAQLKLSQTIKEK